MGAAKKFTVYLVLFVVLMIKMNSAGLSQKAPLRPAARAHPAKVPPSGNASTTTTTTTTTTNEQTQRATRSSNAENIDMTRTAYLLTVNLTSPRTIRSTAILKGVGFTVHHAMAPFLGTERIDKTNSNKLAQMEVYRIIAAGTQPWGYVFEDDIALCRSKEEPEESQFSVQRNLICHKNNQDTCMESKHALGMFLGVCGSKEHVGKEHPGTKPGTPLYCGRCVHSYGVSREGASKAIEYVEKCDADQSFCGIANRQYMDVLIERFCGYYGGFPVSDMECAGKKFKKHKGSFIQDREAFQTILGSPGS
ncbi:unnamed protein product [Cylindrotheca closterium]|uniref:Uncharacterized protein n=1 Tax=Cylindrotheca closterium TaxID=2856 RepID=A0AAD2CS38_9STRA|nr:unnamed protein product [Cylindrotheca closterium]